MGSFINLLILSFKKPTNQTNTLQVFVSQWCKSKSGKEQELGGEMFKDGWYLFDAALC